MGLGPFDLTGGAFLTLYAGLFVASVIAGIIIPRWLRPEGRERPIEDAEQAAWLTGGATRHVDAVVTRLLTTGALSVEKQKIAIAASGPGAVEAALRGLPNPAPWPRVMAAVSRHSRAVEAQLVQAGLLIDQGTAWQLRFWQTTPYALLFLFGAIKWQVGVMRDKPVGFLSLFLVVTAVAALIRFALADRRTRGAMAALARLRERSDRLRRAPTEGEMPMAVALFGTTVLAGSAFDGYHTLRAASSGDSSTTTGDSSSGSSGCGGGGGGGGGGCGGCGGS